MIITRFIVIKTKDILTEMKKFEEKLNELKNIVDELETGNVSLDESLKQFEKGIKLIKDCTGQLQEFEQKVSLLVENSDGGTDIKEFKVDQE